MTTRAQMRTRDATVLELLVDLRVMSLNQLATLRFPDQAAPARAARRWVERLERNDLVESYSVVAYKPCTPQVLHRAEVGSPSPNFRLLSKKLRDRWKGTPTRQLAVRLGAQGAALYGVRQPRRVRESEASHDLHLAEVVLKWRTSGSLSRWQGEASLANSREFVGVAPDGVGFFSSGDAWVVECGGRYSAAKLAKFHAAVMPQLHGKNLSGYLIV